MANVAPGTSRSKDLKEVVFSGVVPPNVQQPNDRRSEGEAWRGCSVAVMEEIRWIRASRMESVIGLKASPLIQKNGQSSVTKEEAARDEVISKRTGPLCRGEERRPPPAVNKE